MSDAPQTPTRATSDAPPGPAAAASGADPDPAPAARSAVRRSLTATLTLGALGAAVVLVAAGETWATGSAPVGATHVPVAVSGKVVTGLPDALALVGLAALVAVFAVRRAGRVLVSVLLALCGAGVVWTSVSGASGDGALDAAAAKASGLTSTAAAHAAHTAWPWLAAFGGLLLLVAGLIAVARGAAWPAMGSRYERDGSPRPARARRAPDPEAPGEIWKALDRGEDPTARD